MGKGRDNIKIKELVLEEGRYIPDCDIEYPETNPFEHIIEVVYNTDKEIKLDDTYPYLDDSFHYKINELINHLGLDLGVIWLNKVKYGLKIEGRKKMRRYLKLYKDGAMTLCNHVYRFDMVSILSTMLFKKLRFPIYGDHIRGKESWYMRYVGGIPIPEEKSGLRRFNEAFDELRRRKTWLHVFPESCSWKYYVPIRPFKKGAFTMAYKYNIPIIPLVISYRERKGIYKWFDKAEVPLITIHVGDAILPDLSKPRKEEIDRLLHESHAQMVKMAGIIKNPWPASID